ncbi:hypothetical protein M436DRAFT_61230 [Aureobasidium namibiae CBS 147.97]|uniref:Uncharacterized protein n=1 Tax=Aureobasidium namibiae CBS 147.97 TaxID=1043004 RepID=A0A074X1L0_9PEZI|nr:uncharacterized protein M436DRAFT_61230 [Aureobasidium namibiae CBS 147.97]KEQ75932.1 hypothetical protein M436DRAFT_61230 [Aureobasidium namibiae CBS 147.97]
MVDDGVVANRLVSAAVMPIRKGRPAGKHMLYMVHRALPSTYTILWLGTENMVVRGSLWFMVTTSHCKGAATRLTDSCRDSRRAHADHDQTSMISITPERSQASPSSALPSVYASPFSYPRCQSCNCILSQNMTMMDSPTVAIANASTTKASITMSPKNTRSAENNLPEDARTLMSSHHQRSLPSFHHPCINPRQAQTRVASPTAMHNNRLALLGMSILPSEVI